MIRNCARAGMAPDETIAELSLAGCQRHHFDLARAICSVPFCLSILSYT
jgi:hypothetical protein